MSYTKPKRVEELEAETNGLKERVNELEGKVDSLQFTSKKAEGERDDLQELIEILGTEIGSIHQMMKVERTEGEGIEYDIQILRTEVESRVERMNLAERTLANLGDGERIVNEQIDTLAKWERIAHIIDIPFRHGNRYKLIDTKSGDLISLIEREAY